MAKMSDDDLLAFLEQREGQCYGFYGGELAEQRATAIDRYLGRPYGDEVEGRSQVVSTGLRDTVEMIMPQILRVFLSGDKIVKFDARSFEDEAQAQLETDYINYIAMDRNESFINISTWFRDALLTKVGYVKVYWHSEESVLSEQYSGKSDEEIALLMQDPEVEVTEHTEYPDPMAPMQVDQMGNPIPAPNLHDVRLRRNTKIEYAKYQPIPPEEMRIYRGHRDTALQDIEMIEHARLVTVSELREMGYKIDDHERFGDDESLTNPEKQARDRYDEDPVTQDDETTDPAMRRVTYREAYVLVDADGDGKAERRKVCVVGRKVMHNEEWDHVPFCAVTPIIFPHRHHGQSMQDLIEQVDSIKTAVIRQYLDALYLSTAPRMIAGPGVNIDDLLTVRPGGIIRTSAAIGDSVQPVIIPDVGQMALQGIEYLDSWKETSTGVNSLYQGINQDALNPSKTASGMSMAMTAAQGRVEAICRTFADTGFKDLIRLLHTLTLKHGTKAEKVKLDGKWQVIDPREWVKRTGLSISVGLGSGTKEMQAAQMQGLIQLQMSLLPLGIANPSNLFNSASRLAQLIGYKNTEEFFTAVDPNQPPPQPPNPMAEAEKVKGQVTLQGKQMELQGDQQKTSAQLQIEKYKTDIDAQTKLQIEQMRISAAQGLKQYEANVNFAMRDAEVGDKAAADGKAAGDVEELKQGQQQMADQMMAGFDGLAQLLQQMLPLLKAASAPRELIRDKTTGRPVGSRPVQH